MSRQVFSCGAMWRLLVQAGSHATEKNLSRAVQKSASGRLDLTALRIRRHCLRVFPPVLAKHSKSFSRNIKRRPFLR